MKDNHFVKALISQVFPHKILYNKWCPNYQDKTVKEQLWNEIGKNLGKSGDDCQKTWKFLRERFTRELKKQNDPSGSGAVDKALWKYYEELIFLKDHIAPRKTKCNSSFGSRSFPVSVRRSSFETKEEILFESVSEQSSSTSGPKLFRIDTFNSLSPIFNKKDEELNTETPTINDDFMRTTVRLISELPPKAQEKTRAKIFQMVSEMRLKHLYN